MGGGEEERERWYAPQNEQVISFLSSLRFFEVLTSSCGGGEADMVCWEEGGERGVREVEKVEGKTDG